MQVAELCSLVLQGRAGIRMDVRQLNAAPLACGICYAVMRYILCTVPHAWILALQAWWFLLQARLALQPTM